MVAHAYSHQAQPLLSPQEYLRLEREAETRSEYEDGELVAMAGARFPHNVMTMNLSIALGNRLRANGKGCRPFAQDLRVKIPFARYYYPDILIVCGEPEFEDEEFDTLLNPVVVMEVLSPSTETRDRGQKWTGYQRIASLRDYVLISLGEVRVEHYIRQETNDWLLHTTDEFAGVLRLDSVECEIPLREIYEEVKLPLSDSNT